MAQSLDYVIRPAASQQEAHDLWWPLIHGLGWVFTYSSYEILDSILIALIESGVGRLQNALSLRNSYNWIWWLAPFGT
jgi:hypothetical protein